MRKATMTLILSVFSAAAIFAHPHMSLESKLEFEYDGKLCEGFWVDWTFDPYFSASIIQEHDKNADRRLSEAEIRSVRDNAFINLRKYGYFTYIRTEKGRRNPESTERFSAEIRGERLAYRFYVKVGENGNVNVAIMDTTYFCAVRYPDQPAAAAQLKEGAPVPSLRRAVDKKNPVYYDPSQTSADNSRHTKWRPGLETAYPEEISAIF